jgi:TrpR family trp operon transcriptional repressor
MNEQTELGWKKLLDLCQQAESTERLDELFGLMFTLEEKDTLATRVLLVLELLKGNRTQREIAQHLNISIAKITRGSNALKTVNDSLKDFLLA